MVLPSGASGGKKDTPELTSTTQKAAKDISKRETREKRQYFARNSHLGIPRYMPFAVPQRYYPMRQPVQYTRKAYNPFDGVHGDPDKPRISVHIEAEKKNYITHIDDEAGDERKKRQLFGMTSIMSPAQPIKSPISSYGSNEENTKSEVPKHRNIRDTITEVPIRAEQHHGVVKTSISLMNEAEDTKKSTIQRLQKRHAKYDENEYQHTPIRKRQFVLNSEPPVVRATVKGEKQSGAAAHSPIGNLIKMIAGHTAKNILGLNSKSFDVFPGPLPDAKDSSVWNIKSAEAGNTEPASTTETGALNQAFLQQGQAGLESLDDSQQRAQALQSAEQQAEAEKEAYINAQNEAVRAQTAAKIQQQNVEEAKLFENEKEVEQEQELEQARANEMAKLVRERANDQFIDMTRGFTPAASPLRPMGAMMVPVQQEFNDADTPADADEEGDTMAYRNHVIPTMLPTMMPIQPDDFQPTQIQVPMAAMAFQAERLPPMPLMRPTPAAFIPTPSMMFMRTPEMLPFTEPPTPFFQDLESIHRPEFARSSDEDPYLQPYPIHKRHHRKHLFVPTESPFRYSNILEPEMTDDEQKPEVHVHIQTEKSKIPQSQRHMKGNVNRNL